MRLSRRIQGIKILKKSADFTLKLMKWIPAPLPVQATHAASPRYAETETSPLCAKKSTLTC